MITIASIADFIEHEYGLRAHCQQCHRFADIDLEKLSERLRTVVCLDGLGEAQVPMRHLRGRQLLDHGCGARYRLTPSEEAVRIRRRLDGKLGVPAPELFQPWTALTCEGASDVELVCRERND